MNVGDVVRVGRRNSLTGKILEIDHEVKAGERFQGPAPNGKTIVHALARVPYDASTRQQRRAAARGAK